MSFIVSLRTTIYQIEKKGGEKEFQEGLFLFTDEITKRSEATPLLKGVSIQYNLTGETASFFFAFVNKVKFWMQVAGLQVPLLVPWVTQVEDKDIKTQLTQWNSASFDAWVAYLFSPGEIQYFVNQLESATTTRRITKKTKETKQRISKLFTITLQQPFRLVLSIACYNFNQLRWYQFVFNKKTM